MWSVGSAGRPAWILGFFPAWFREEPAKPWAEAWIPFPDQTRVISAIAIRNFEYHRLFILPSQAKNSNGSAIFDHIDYTSNGNIEGANSHSKQPLFFSPIP
jgi:hypothetical protein